MKVNAFNVNPSLLNPSSSTAGRDEGGARGVAAADGASLSADAKAILGGSEATASEFRADLVADIKAQLQAGTFEQNVDTSYLVDSLLADL